MFTFDDSPLSGATGQNAYVAPGSPTPIFDRLFEEWQRMFRAVPGDRYGEGFAAATGLQSGVQPGVQGYSSGGYPVPPSMSAQMPSQMPSQMSSSQMTSSQMSSSQMSSSASSSMPSSMPVPAFRSEQGQGQGYPQGFGGSGGFGGPQTPQHGGPQSSGAHQAHTPPPMHSQSVYDSYAQQSRPTNMPSRSGGSGLALMPVAGYQTQHMPL